MGGGVSKPGANKRRSAKVHVAGPESKLESSAASAPDHVAANHPSPDKQISRRSPSGRSLSPRVARESNSNDMESERSPVLSGDGRSYRSPIDPRRIFSRRSSESSVPNSDGFNEENMESLAYSAMALGMDNEELLFNMFYFGDSEGTGFRQSMNTAIEETYAAHSTGNTPYKLKPVDNECIHKLITENTNLPDIPDGEECLICQELLKGADQLVVTLSTCKHNFHEECVLKWFTLQNWCPICRSVLGEGQDDKADAERLICKDAAGCSVIDENQSPASAPSALEAIG